VGEATFDIGSTLADPIDEAVIWLRDHLSWLTRPLNDFLVADVIVATKKFLLDTVAWPVLVALPAVLALLLKRPWLALGSAAGVVLAGCTGLWAESIDTLVQVMVAVVIAVAIAVPCGIALGRRPRLESAMGPLLDALQTVPSMVYAVPFVMFFAVGPVPGLIASVLYALPPGIRLTALGVRETDGPATEAATTFGATRRQVLWGVRVPMAMPSIILAVNQVIMMVLAMVIIAGFVGGGAIGFAAVEALTRPNTGLGVEVAVVIVVMAMILDRLTQALAERLRPPTSS
jgi:ABC-type proline/glycine betaine transport system permease subunit